MVKVDVFAPVAPSQNVKNCGGIGCGF